MIPVVLTTTIHPHPHPQDFFHKYVWRTEVARAVCGGCGVVLLQHTHKTHITPRGVSTSCNNSNKLQYNIITSLFMNMAATGAAAYVGAVAACCSAVYTARPSLPAPAWSTSTSSNNTNSSSQQYATRALFIIIRRLRLWRAWRLRRRAVAAHPGVVNLNLVE